MSVIPFRKFSRKDLENEYRMELLKVHGTESGQRLRAFILDSYDDGMGEDCDTADEFISLCTEVFEDLENDNESSQS